MDLASYRLRETKAKDSHGGTHAVLGSAPLRRASLGPMNRLASSSLLGWRELQNRTRVQKRTQHPNSGGSVSKGNFPVVHCPPSIKLQRTS